MAIALIALGSNVGDAPTHLREAIDLLSREMTVTAISEAYETDPMYVLDQPKFLNAALAGETELGPLPLLALLKKIEREVGRMSRERYGPREVDLDLIAYGSLKYKFVKVGETVLEVPHPRTPERRFVLQPLNDFAPQFVLPGLGSVESLLEATKQQAASVQRRVDVALSLHRV